MVSYRALLRVPHLPRVLLSMQIARVAQSMVSVALVLFTLERFNSSTFAGFVTFASIFPGLLTSPIAGVLLDRHGRIRLVRLDYLVALAAMMAIGVLASVDALPGPLLIAIAVVSSLTSILGHVGLRSLFPILVPEPLWERVNAIDSNGYVIATIVGPPMAAALVATTSGPVALMAIGIAFGVAAAVLVGVPEPVTRSVGGGRILAQAWEGVRYTWRNPTLRGLGFAITAMNVAHGMTSIIVPLLVIERFRLSEAVVGFVFAASGVSGVASAFAFGRVNTRGREWALLVLPSIAFIPTVALLLAAAKQTSMTTGVAVLVLEMVLVGLLAGPIDIALFTVRQRRTDPAWMGRAFAVSMAFNYLGMPVGAALAGVLAERSIEMAILTLGVGGATAAAVLAALLVPRHDIRADTSNYSRSSPVSSQAEPYEGDRG
jgi:MFS family permease